MVVHNFNVNCKLVIEHSETGHLSKNMSTTLHLHHTQIGLEQKSARFLSQIRIFCIENPNIIFFILFETRAR